MYSLAAAGVLLLIAGHAHAPEVRAGAPHTRARQFLKATLTPILGTDICSGCPYYQIGWAVETTDQGLDIDVLSQKTFTPCPKWGQTQQPSNCSITGFGCCYEPVYVVDDPTSTAATWQSQHPARLMINGTYFYDCFGESYHQTNCVNSSGPLVINGTTYDASSYTKERKPLDAFVVLTDETHQIMSNADFQTALAQNQVKHAIGGNFFINAGTYNSDCDKNCHQAGSREARTAIGLGPNLVVVVLQPGSGGTGAKASELATFMTTKFNTQAALMLDGGGSSQFSFNFNGEYKIARPGDVEGYRPVPNAIAINGLQ